MGCAARLVLLVHEQQAQLRALGGVELPELVVLKQPLSLLRLRPHAVVTCTRAAAHSACVPRAIYACATCVPCVCSGYASCGHFCHAAVTAAQHHRRALLLVGAAANIHRTLDRRAKVRLTAAREHLTYRVEWGGVAASAPRCRCPQCTGRPPLTRRVLGCYLRYCTRGRSRRAAACAPAPPPTPRRPRRPRRRTRHASPPPSPPRGCPPSARAASWRPPPAAHRSHR